jgi:hypothetical protein
MMIKNRVLSVSLSTILFICPLGYQLIQFPLDLYKLAKPYDYV